MERKNQLLLLLDGNANGLPVADLPSELRDTRLLNVCHADGLVKFGEPGESYTAMYRNGRSQYKAKPCWKWGDCYGVTKPSHPECRVCLTAKGQAECDRLIVEGDGANSANIQKLFPKGEPENVDVKDLAIRLQTEADSGKPMTQIAREFTGETIGSDKQAKSLLAEIRRQRKDRRINL